MVYVLAIAGALSNALTTILQRLGVEDAPAEDSLHLSLIAYAVRRKVWLLGCVGLVAGFLLQAFALHVGRLTIVQPILTLELPFLVAILAFWFRKNLSWKEWTGAIVATAGLALFLALAVPQNHLQFYEIPQPFHLIEMNPRLPGQINRSMLDHLPDYPKGRAQLVPQSPRLMGCHNRII